MQPIEQGFNAGRANQPLDNCPFDGKQYEEYKYGWRIAKAFPNEDLITALCLGPDIVLDKITKCFSR